MAYKSDQIKVLKGLDPVRHRPGMYTRVENPNHIIYEVIDNAQDEALAGFANTIAVEILADGFVAISDNGRGIPVDKMKEEGGRSAVEVIFTELHSGGKFDKDNEDSAYRFSGGLHGVGVSVTNALSSHLEAIIKRDGSSYNIKFSDGSVVQPLKKISNNINETGTTVVVKPNPKYFESANIDIEALKNYLKVKSALLSNVKIIFKDLNKEPIEWKFTSIKEYLINQASLINNNQNNLNEKFFNVQKYAESDNGFIKKGEGLDCVIGFFEEGKKIGESFVNLIHTIGGGRHEQGLRLGLFDGLKSFMGHYNLMPPKLNIEADDLWNKVSFILSIKMVDPSFQNQTKDKLNSENAQKFVFSYVKDFFEIWLNENNEFGKFLAELVISQALKRTRSELKTERKKSGANVTLPGKLSDCTTTDVNEAELFLVEGDSAGGCFYAYTKIALADGRKVNFLDLIRDAHQGKKNYCYTINSNNQIITAEILHPRLTKKEAKVIKLILNNHKTLICTPDHLFLTNLGYIEAQKLNNEITLTNQHNASIFVEKIEEVKNKIDVYDLEVAETHNFMLANGVFVHNSSKQGRDKNFQAILPLRGKLLNTWEVESHLLFKTSTVEDIAIAVGIPPHHLDDTIDWEKLRYGKICIMCDADVDGRHIQVLLLTMFFKHFPQLIKRGHVYVAQAPLYRIDAPATKSAKKLERKFYVLTDDEKKEIEEKLVKEGIDLNNTQTARFKGLGEMNPEQLWETTMDPNSRRLIKVTFDDNHLKYDINIFNLLMSNKNASSRRTWMEENGNKVEADM